MMRRLLYLFLGVAAGVSPASAQPNDPGAVRHQTAPAEWRMAEPGLRYEFPRDHQVHPDFKTEWWYFTGNLTTARGGRYGYELTFFRQGIRPPAERGGTKSRFVVDDLKFAHFTVTDPAGRKFLFDQKISRGSFGEASFAAGERLAWIDGWELKLQPDGAFDLAAQMTGASVNLHLVPRKAPVIHGANGISEKAAGADRASYYYSITRLQTTGELQLGEERLTIAGESWFDHEWATNQLAAGQAGWNWVSAQFDDGSELMLYQMRLTNGEIDPVSSGTFVRADGSSVPLTSADFQMTATASWKSKTTGANYPISWKAKVPREKLELTIAPVLSNQELVLAPIIYWEGAFEIEGSHADHRIGGHGYLELTGYAAPLTELNR